MRARPGWALVGLVSGLALMGIVLCASESRADELWPYRVAVLGPPPVYSDPALSQQEIGTPNLSRQELNREITSLFDFDPRFEPALEDDIRRMDFEVVRRHQVEANLADMHRLNGMEEFGRYDLGTAIFSLEQAVDYYLASGSVRANPRDVATTYEYLALAYFERAQIRPGDASQSRTDARAAFREMIRLNPNATIDPNRYPGEVVSLYRDAYYDLIREDGVDLDLSPASAEQLADRHQLDYLVHTYFLRDATSIRMAISIFNVGVPSASTREVIVLTEDTESSRERVNRALSRFMACVPIRYRPPPPPPAGDENRVFIQAGWASTLYGTKPTERQFLNQGVVFTLSYHFSNFLALFGRANVLFGERDPDGNLLRGFTSFRSVLGMILSYRLAWLRMYLSVGVEGNRVGAFRATDDFWCKVTGGDYVTYEPSRDCLAHEVTIQENLFLVGPHLLAGVSFDVVAPFSLFLAGNFAFYLSESTRDLGFPFGFEAGIEYRF